MKIMKTLIVDNFAKLVKLINSGKVVKFRLVTSPDMANQIIEKFNIENRAVSQQTVDEYIRLMQGGHWLEGDGVDPLKFDALKRLFNGQHRLWAVILSGVTVTFNVEVNIPPEVAKIQDALYVRNSSQTSPIVTKENAAVMKYLTGLRLTALEAEQFLAFHREAFDFVFSHFTAHKKRVTIAPVIGECVKAFYHLDRQKLAHIIEVLISGNQETRADRTITKLRDQLYDGTGFSRDGKGQVIYWPKIQYAFVSAAQGKSLSKLAELAAPAFLLPGETIEIIRKK